MTDPEHVPVTGSPPGTAIADHTAWRAWFWPLWLTGLVLALTLSVAAWSHPHLPGDIPIARAIQSSPFPAVVANAVSTIGGGIPATAIVVLVTVLFLLARRRDLAVVFVAASVLGLVSGPLKILVDRARPAPPLVKVSVLLSDRSFPSGHVLHAVLSFGLLAILVEDTALPRLLRRLAQAACLVMVILMGISRVYVGAHWPSDVLGGYLYGAVILAAIIHFARIKLPRPRGRSTLES